MNNSPQKKQGEAGTLVAVGDTVAGRWDHIRMTSSTPWTAALLPALSFILGRSANHRASICGLESPSIRLHIGFFCFLFFSSGLGPGIAKKIKMRKSQELGRNFNCSACFQECLCLCCVCQGGGEEKVSRVAGAGEGCQHLQRSLQGTTIPQGCFPFFRKTALMCSHFYSDRSISRKPLSNVAIFRSIGSSIQESDEHLLKTQIHWPARLVLPVKHYRCKNTAK